MSINQAVLSDVLYTRSMFAKAGAKKQVKVALSRASRRSGKQADSVEARLLAVQTAVQTAQLDGHALSQRELDEMANSLLACSPADDDIQMFEPELTEDEDSPSLAIPLYLQGSLPEHMLARLEAANGDAFDALSLFEAKRLSPKAAIELEDDERQFA